MFENICRKDDIEEFISVADGDEKLCIENFFEENFFAEKTELIFLVSIILITYYMYFSGLLTFLMFKNMIIFLNSFSKISYKYGRRI